MLKLVSNTTPIISLLKLDRLDILKQLYSSINIPVAVYQEIETGKAKAYYKELSEIIWINIVAIKNKQAVRNF